MYYWNYGIHITCLYLSEALSGFYASSHPRLRSLRSLSLGILRTSLRGYKLQSRLEDGDKSHPLESFGLGAENVT